MRNKNIKERVVVWLKPDIITKMNKHILAEDLKNETEFIEKAIDFYLGFIGTSDSTSFLSETLLTAIEGNLKSTETRFANNLFRLSTEMSVMANIMAYGLDITDEQLSQTRARCINEIKNNRGRISLEDAMEYQNK